MKICDLTQFYSPVSGGVKRYLKEKSNFIQKERQGDRHIWIVPGETTSVTTDGSVSIYTIRSPLVSRTSRYRFLWRVDLVEAILERELPDIVESGDPYQMAWKATTSARALGLKCVGFYHSHFPEAYVRSVMKFAGQVPTDMMMEFCRSYVVNLYNRFDRTFIPSEALARVLHSWGVENLSTLELGVDTEVFRPDHERGLKTRQRFGIGPDEKVLLYVGRLASEKNVGLLFDAFESLHRDGWGGWLIVVGDGMERWRLERLSAETGRVKRMPYCESSEELADIYRAADVFVHPSVQETFGLVTLESQACGTPVIGIRGSYMDRIIFTGLNHLAGENSVESMVEAIKCFMREDCALIGLKASAQVRSKFSWSQVFRRAFEVYESLCSK